MAKIKNKEIGFNKKLKSTYFYTMFGAFTWILFFESFMYFKSVVSVLHTGSIY